MDADVSEQTLDELQEAGFCGVRMNLLFKGGIECKIIGKGDKTLVLAHGFGCDQNMWRFVTPVQALARASRNA